MIEVGGGQAEWSLKLVLEMLVLDFWIEILEEEERRRKGRGSGVE